MPPIRVVIQQPALTRYRVPVFRELARRPGIDLLVVYGQEAGIRNEAPEGFEGRVVPIRDYMVRRAPVRYHAAQVAYASRRRCDVLVLSWSTRYVTLLPGLVRAHWNNVGCVLWGHGFSKSETRLRAGSRAALSDFADSVLFYDYATAQRFIDDGRAAPERVFVALNTLDVEPVRAQAAAWRADPAAIGVFKGAKGLDPGPVVLFVSRLLPPNRTDMLVEAAAILRREFPAVRVVIIGEGPDRGNLGRLAERLGVAEHVVFVGAVYREEDLAPWFVAADLFCYPVNIGLSLIHAFGYGAPVVTSDRRQAQNPEIEAFRDGVNGAMYAHGNIGSLVETLGALLRDPARRARLAAGAAATVDGDYSIIKMVDGMESSIRYAAFRHT